ncbi:MAG: PAS domain S-box protein, partial [Dehalococcoidia bacterium]|nr:PAS domain S-box protein [Dehalococcoidia bacterium]
LITIPHYQEFVTLPSFIGLNRHTLERIAYLVPIILSGFVFGWRGAVATSVVALACMLPQAIFISQSPKNALFETGAVFIVGNMVALGLGSLRREREHRIRLAALNYISNVVSQSLELDQILNSSIDSIIEIMNVDVVLIFRIDGEAGELVLNAHRGVSDTFVSSVARLKVGGGLNGMVAQTGEPALIRNASKDHRLTKTAVKEEGIRSQVIVPLKSKGKVMGTICVAMHRHRQFNQDEVELLAAVGNQIGVAIENASLFEEERKVAEQLRVSEERYRALFQNAHDAIWVHDMDGNIVSANVAAARLTGYEVEELCRMNVKSFLSEGSLHLAKEIRNQLLDKRAASQPYEQKLITKEGVEAILKLTTDVVEVNGEAIGFQHIARDVTEEKRMQESLRFYLGQITMAQEEERKRIARELHDETIQSLVVLARQLDDIASGGKGLSEYKKIQLDILRERINNVMADVRRLSQDLRPPALDRLGLLPALEWLASDIGKRSGMNIEVTVKGVSRRFSPEVELVLFRVAQEALRNTLRHSQATSAEVAVEFGEKLIRIIVKDNGQGFYLPETTGDLVKRGRLGLAGMQERIKLVGGSLKISSKPGKGTIVTIEAPA